jgi:hypothetical protein
MKFNCGPTKEELYVAKRKAFDAVIKRRLEGEKVFAWLPKRIGSGDCRWLEFVIRKDSNLFYSDYRQKIISYSDRYTPRWKYEAIE